MRFVVFFERFSEEVLPPNPPPQKERGLREKMWIGVFIAVSSFLQ